MRKLLMICASLMAVSASAQGVSDKYRAIWGDSVQMSIDRQIEKNRKADAVIRLKDVAVGTEVKVANTLRVMDQPFGVLPFPKLDENQSDYRSTALNQLSVATIPVTADKPEDCALLLDLLSCESDKQVLRER